ncbi:MAG: sugar phosphate isomerase/epimerase [Deltaproteobacteria bacterium]|nr:sugar phosphate isomerase/epimerase [Deltaproteobacteria bacterium]
MDFVLSINTLTYEGYDLATALEEIAKAGASHVELGFTRGFTKGLTEEYFSESSAQKITRLLSDMGLSSIALSAHTDLTTGKAVDELKRRIDFGKRLGVEVVNTKVGAKSGRKQYEKNIELIADYAESMNIIVGLENPAEGTDQILTSGKTGAELIRSIGSDFIKLNYDFGNAFTYSKGKVDPATDYKEALPYACYLHLKDMKKIDDGWEFSQIGKGIINYDLIFKELVEGEKLLPLSIEHLFIYSASEDFIVQRLQQPLPLSHISSILKNSIAFVNSVIRKSK